MSVCVEVEIECVVRVCACVCWDFAAEEGETKKGGKNSGDAF